MLGDDPADLMAFPYDWLGMLAKQMLLLLAHGLGRALQEGECAPSASDELTKVIEGSFLGVDEMCWCNGVPYSVPVILSQRVLLVKRKRDRHWNLSRWKGLISTYEQLEDTDKND